VSLSEAFTVSVPMAMAVGMHWRWVYAHSVNNSLLMKERKAGVPGRGAEERFAMQHGGCHFTAKWVAYVAGRPS
jgi:hypothetical protein